VKVTLAVLALVLSSPAFAAPEAKTLASIKQTLEARFPEHKFEAVQPGPIPGIYEVFTGDGIAYTDKTASYLFAGPLIDTRTRNNLSVQRMDERRAVDFSTLPLDRAIKIVKGDGSRKVAVFSDPDCPFCQQLEKDLQSVTDITAYVFLYPIASLHPDAPAKAHAIWCSPDRASAWTQWMIERKAPAYTTCDGDPVDELQTLGNQLRVGSTPTMFFENGRRISGAPGPGQLAAALDKTRETVSRN
jgi:thiol:disulfide interchange protein DsbC